MWLRTTTGLAALGVYGWRVQDPVGSYAGFYQVSDALTGLFVANTGVEGLLRNLVSLVLIDQADGFLLGMAFMALLSVVLWPCRMALGALTTAVGRMRR